LIFFDLYNCRISGLLRTVGRLIRARQEERAIEKSESPPVRFNILSDGHYAKVKLAADQAVLRSSGKIIRFAFIVFCTALGLYLRAIQLSISE
jgi:hypothetical protein